jgi:hypothetical protein
LLVVGVIYLPTIYHFVESNHMGRLNYEHILRIEKETTQHTDLYLSGARKFFPVAIDTLVQLMYFTGKKNGGDPEGDFHVFCWNQYYHSGYSSRAGLILYERGYYLEANILLRKMIEALVKMRYLEKHKDLAMIIWTDKKGRMPDGLRKPHIKDMFNEVAPELYENIYGLLLSGFAHGGIGAGFGKINYRASGSPSVALGPVWSEDSATFYVNMFTMIALGYLVYFPIAFRDNFKSVDHNLLVQYAEIMDWLRKSLDSHKSKYPDSLPWHDAIAPIIN